MVVGHSAEYQPLFLWNKQLMMHLCAWGDGFVQVCIYFIIYWLIMTTRVETYTFLQV